MSKIQQLQSDILEIKNQIEQLNVELAQKRKELKQLHSEALNNRINNFPIETVLKRILEGESQKAVAKSLGMSTAVMIAHIEKRFQLKGLVRRKGVFGENQTAWFHKHAKVFGVKLSCFWCKTEHYFSEHVLTDEELEAQYKLFWKTNPKKKQRRWVKNLFRKNSMAGSNGGSLRRSIGKI